MRSAWSALLLCAITAACVERQGGREDAIGDTGSAGSSESSTTGESGTGSTDTDADSNSNTSTSSEADVETGPFPDLPSELPTDCEPVFIGEPKPSVPTADSTCTPAPPPAPCRTANDECTFETECRCNWHPVEERWICDQDNRICD